MPVDWDGLKAELPGIIEESGNRTDERLASRISSLVRMTDEEIQELFPDPADVAKLADLMTIVKSAEDRNTKINNLVANAESLSGVVLTLLGKFV